MRATIRDARLSDAAVLCGAEQAVVRAADGMLVTEPDELSVLAFADRIGLQATGRVKVLVAEMDGQAVGHASLYPMGLRKVAHVLRLDMCVHLGHWRRGLGTALLAQLLDWARHRSGASKVELLVRATNAGAVALYERAGFFLEGRLVKRVRLRDGSFVDDLSMGLWLKPESH